MQVLDGTIKQKGILAPITRELNDPIMKELKETYGITMQEKVIR